ncbi:MAG: hypothetical protein DRP70_12165 [Spirochaetes bacterium]|nr:MAG: hypothetical protein DRP60_04350 [Spirochaetota bacterium]RKX85115.1 MAG: hypothetical protein DRP70_12165 [Spirochaetota bacterium]RKX98907.1 MAG: hypothetical protein DRZ90_01040 [Spirochaetota bacterium]
MRFIGNLLWLIFGGSISAVLWTISGLLMSITIIGFPFGKQHIKLARLSLIPFGTDIHPV